MRKLPKNFRRAASQSGRRLAQSLMLQSDNLQAADGALTNGAVRIFIVPRRFRMFDRVVVQFNCVDVWLPIRFRRRIRRHVRRLIAIRTKAALS